MGKQTATEYMTRMDALMPLFLERLAAGQTVRFSLWLPPCGAGPPSLYSPPRGANPHLLCGHHCVGLAPSFSVVTSAWGCPPNPLCGHLRVGLPHLSFLWSPLRGLAPFLYGRLCMGWPPPSLWSPPHGASPPPSLWSAPQS